MGLPENVELVVNGPVNHGVEGIVADIAQASKAGYGAGKGVKRSIGDRANTQL